MIAAPLAPTAPAASGRSKAAARQFASAGEPPAKKQGRAQTASAGDPPAPRQFAPRQAICATVQAILDARKLYLDASLADLYDELAMPSELRKAHQENDRAVMAAYGFPKGMTESECVAELFRRYQVLVAAEKGGQR